MAFSTGNVLRVWNKRRTTFDRIPIRGQFTFVNGNPSGVFIKISPTTFALPASVHYLRGGGPRTVLNRGSGNNQTSTSDFAYYQGATTHASRSDKVIEVNPSAVAMEADKHDY